MKAKCLGLLLTTLVLATAIGLGFTSTAAASEDEIDSIVYPTGLYPEDLQNVQAAVDQGGTILLKAADTNGGPTAFNFGPPFAGSDYVLLTRDVTILGETVGSHMTTIRGGEPPFLGVSRAQSTIRGIHFDGPGTAALLLLASTGAEFAYNRVTDVIGLPDYLPGLSKGQAVWVATFDPSFISGQLIIADNVIDGINADLSYGLALFIFGAEAHVVRNEIRGTDSTGILAAFNTQPVWIEDNLIVPGPAVGLGFGNGISAQWSLGGAFYIRGNTVECENPLADGIYLAGDAFFGVADSVIEGNRVVMHDSLYGGITLYGNVQGAYVGQNLIEGSGFFALQASVGLVPEDTAVSNTFMGNNIALFESQVADVFLDVNSQDTVLAGLSGTVIDLGVNNRITGYTKIGMSEPIGQQIREGQALRRTLWETHQTYAPPSFPE